MIWVVFKLTHEFSGGILHLDQDEGEKDDELEPLLQQRRHDCHPERLIEVERVPEHQVTANLRQRNLFT